MMRRKNALRARDGDRIDVMARLDEAFADGQLSVDEHIGRVDAARQSVTLGELEALTSDLQISPVPRRYRPAARAARVFVGLAALAVMVVVAVGTVVWFVPDRPGAAVGSETARSPEVDRLVGGEVFTSAGMDEVVVAIRKKFGTTVIEGVHFLRDYAEVWVPETSSPTGSARYAYSLGGDFHSRQVYSGQSVSSDPAARVDVAKLDTSRVAELIASAPEKLGLTTAKLAPSLAFRVTVGGDGGGEIWMGINGIGIDSHLVAGLDGSIKGVHRCGWGC